MAKPKRPTEVVNLRISQEAMARALEIAEAADLPIRALIRRIVEERLSGKRDPVLNAIFQKGKTS